jgi:hypothetical protein
MLDQATLSLKRILAKTNALLCDGCDDISFEEAKNPSSTVYSSVTTVSLPSSRLPASVKRRLIELHCLGERCSEEISLIKADLTNLKAFYEGQLVTIHRVIGQDPIDNSKLSFGLQSMLRRKQTLVHNELYLLGQTLGEFFPDIGLTGYGRPHSYEISFDGSCVYPLPGQAEPVNENDDVEFSTLECDNEEYQYSSSDEAEIDE